MTRAFAISGWACLALAAAAEAAKPNITVSRLGIHLQITFVAPVTTTRETGYFVRIQTAPQEGCSWKSTSLGRLGAAGQKVYVDLGPNTRQGRDFCTGPAKITVFLQRRYGGFVAKDATPSTFKLVGTARYTVKPR